MMNTLSALTTRFYHLLQRIRLSAVFALLLASFVLTAATPAKADHPRNYRELPRDIKETIHNDASDRPKTTGEWQAEAEEVEGQPVERAKRIAKESADAVEDFAGLYPDVAERTTLQDDKVVNSR